MPTGKRASMREGPLAALFRKTAEDTGQPVSPTPSVQPAAAPGPPTASPPEGPEAHASPPPAPPEEPERHIPSPQERLRHAFSADIPENVMAAPQEAALPPAPDGD